MSPTPAPFSLQRTSGHQGGQRNEKGTQAWMHLAQNLFQGPSVSKLSLPNLPLIECTGKCNLILTSPFACLRGEHKKTQYKFVFCLSHSAVTPVTGRQVTRSPDQLPEESGHSRPGPWGSEWKKEVCIPQTALSLHTCLGSLRGPACLGLAEAPLPCGPRVLLGKTGTRARAQCPLGSQEP